jgi:hypothetical protein
MEQISKQSNILDTSNLTPNTTIKNYKIMCRLLNEPEKTGNAKRAQIETWKCYFDFTMQGYAFKIGEVYKIPKGKLTKRYGFINYIEELIVDLLVQDKNNGIVFLSKNKLFKELEMININYSYGRYNIPKLSQLINVHEDNIQEFYTLSSSTLVRNVETALNRLKNKSLVYWQPTKTVCFINTNVPTNEAGNAKAKENYLGKNEYDEDIYVYDVDYKVKQVHREATEEEVKLIIHTEHEVMQEMGYKDKREIVIRNKWDRFMTKVKKILFDKMNILFYYESYKIICNEDHILSIWNDLKELQLESQDRKIKQNMLNDSIVNKLNENGRQRNKQAKKEEYKDIQMKKRRRDDQYIIDNDTLVNVLINNTYPDIRNEIRNIELDKK